VIGPGGRPCGEVWHHARYRCPYWGVRLQDFVFVVVTIVIFVVLALVAKGAEKL
jgi:hypothetical protein